MHRRSFLAGLAVAVTSRRARAAPSAEERLSVANKRLAEIEAREGGRLGVFVRDTGAGATIEHRADERFPMCSTFKLLAAAAALKRVDNGAERLDRKIAYGPDDLLEYAPITKAHVAEGGMTVADLCAAAIDWSDNTAANLVLRTIGGPAGFTHFASSLGDEVTRLDRNEPSLNEATPGDPRDTTSSRAMAASMQKVLVGDALSDWITQPAANVAHRRQGRRQKAARRAAALMADRRQDRHRRARIDECGRNHLAARSRAPHRHGLLHRVIRVRGRAQRGSQGDRRPHRRDVLTKRAGAKPALVYLADAP